MCILLSDAYFSIEKPGNAYQQASECQKLAETDQELAHMFFNRAIALEALNNDLPEWQSQLAQGEIKEVNSWLKEKIHSKGNCYDPEELIDIVTGNTLNPSLFINYLTDKYSKLYGF